MRRSVKRGSTGMRRQNRVRSDDLPEQSIAERKSLDLPARLSYDFFYYTKTVLQRLGLTEGCVVASRHNGTIGSVHFHGGVRRRFGIRRRICLSEESERVLHERLDRLTRGCNIRFGSIIIDVSSGGIDNAEFTESVRPGGESGSRHFCSIWSS